MERSLYIRFVCGKKEQSKLFVSHRVKNNKAFDYIFWIYAPAMQSSTGQSKAFQQRLVPMKAEDVLATYISEIILRD